MALSNVKIAGIATAIVIGMTGLAFASEPLYNTFCKVTGFGGTTRVATEAPSAVLDREVAIRFDANVNNAPLLFKPLKTELDIKLGEHGLAFYEVTNTSSKPVTAIASYNVTPHKTGPYFNKLECFCFTEQVYQPGETRKLPVIFFIAPEMDEEKNLKDVRTITLSYTFFEAADYEGPRGAAKSAALNTGIAAQ